MFYDPGMQIYRYLNLSFSLHVEKSVLNMTSSGIKEAGALSTMKGNSTEILYKWRNTAKINLSPMFYDPGICIHSKFSPMFYDLGNS
jgi:hypothetical protein